MHIIKIDSTPSTNLYLKNLLEEGSLQEGTVIVANEQTAGRGQAGARWESEPGKNLTFSLLLYPRFLCIDRYFLLSKAVSLGITDYLEKFVDSLSVKWPNDIYYQDKKLAGILIENQLTGSVIEQSVAGIGINVNQERFSADIPNPVSIKNILGAEIDADILLVEIVESILTRYEALKEEKYEAINDDYFSRLYRRNDYYPYKDKDGQFNASIQSVDDAGFLYLLTDAGELRKYAFKEVAIVC